MPMYDSSYLVAASVIMPYTDATGNKNRINFGYWIFDKDTALFLQVSFKFYIQTFFAELPAYIVKCSSHKLLIPCIFGGER